MNTNKKKLRSYIFYHLDGIAIIPTVLALGKKKILNEFKDEKISLSLLSKKYNANEGYLNIALRLLCCQGWLTQFFEDNDIFFQKNNSVDLIEIFNIYKQIELFFENDFDYDIILEFKENKITEDEVQLQKMIDDYLNNRKDLIKLNDESINLVNHIDGVILGPILVNLSRRNYLNLNSYDNFNINNRWKQILKKLFIYLNIIKIENNSVTELGKFLFKRASAYGVTVSYLPTFRKLNELIFDNPFILWEKEENSAEIHVDRKMNVWGSGGAHKLYFKKVDEIIINLFNLPIEQQPKGFIDIGCGDGSLIEHIFDLIYYKTERGKNFK